MKLLMIKETLKNVVQSIIFVALLSNFSKKWCATKYVCCLSIYCASICCINARWISICCVGSHCVSAHCTSAYCVRIYYVSICCASAHCASAWKINIFICNHKNILASSSVLMPICGKKNDDADSINAERKRRHADDSITSCGSRWMCFHLVAIIPT